MSFVKTQIGEISYNPVLEAFEAMVCFHSHAGTLRVPAHFHAPLTADFTRISNGLLQDALRQRASENAMRSHRPVAEFSREPLRAA